MCQLVFFNLCVNFTFLIASQATKAKIIIAQHNFLTPSIIVLGKDYCGTASFRKSRAMRSWVGLGQFEKLRSGGLLRVFNLSLIPDNMSLIQS